MGWHRLQGDCGVEVKTANRSEMCARGWERRGLQDIARRMKFEVLESPAEVCMVGIMRLRVADQQL